MESRTLDQDLTPSLMAFSLLTHRFTSLAWVLGLSPDLLVQNSQVTRCPDNICLSSIKTCSHIVERSMRVGVGL